LAGDVAGYSRLMGADEVGTLSALKAHQRELIDPLLGEYHGRMVKTTGDGILAEFASAVDAVGFAVVLQKRMADRNDDVPQDRRIAFRVGINIGDIIVEDNDIYGDGVNVAARLEALAEPGGICISEDAYRQVRDKLPYEFADRGEQIVKNIARPVRVYALDGAAVRSPPAAQMGANIRSPPIGRRFVWRRIWPAAAALTSLLVVAFGIWFVVAPAKAPSPETPIRRFSIVVLPFANLSGDPGQDYLSDVITEGLTTALARIKDSFVIARSTAFTYKGKPIDVKQIGKDLGVRYVLEGSAERAGDRVRVNAQLIDAETGAHLWADQFDADRSDLLQMQDEIITRLARAIAIQFLAVDVARLTRARPENPDAQDLAEQCQAGLFNSGSEKTRIDTAYHFCERALQMDHRNVLALSLVSFKYIEPVISAQSANPQADIRQADELATQALATDPDMSLPHLAKAYILMAQNRAEEAIVEAERSLESNPSYVTAYDALAAASNFAGRPDRALEFADKAIRLSPRDPGLPWFYHDKGWAFFMRGQYDQAIEWLDRAVAIAPRQRFTQLLLASAFALTGHEAEAHAALQRYLALAGTNSRTITQLRAGQLAIANNPVWVEYNERLFDGLRKAGMADQ
jgi:TolB-like protein/class 3 adenylate cyclase/Flp pilus assembly protein TadD